MARPTPKQDDPGIPVVAFATDAATRVAVAGLLASDPSLADASLTRLEWQQRLDDYLTSPRP